MSLRAGEKYRESEKFSPEYGKYSAGMRIIQKMIKSLEEAKFNSPAAARRVTVDGNSKP